MVGYASRRKAPPKPTEGRVIAVFGAPNVGTSTCIKCLHDASRKTLAVVKVDSDTTIEAIALAIEDKRATKLVEAIFLDGFPRSAADVQAMFEQGWAFIGEGAVVLMRCGQALPAEHESIEQALRQYSIPYFTVMNEKGEAGLASAVEQLARFAQIKD